MTSLRTTFESALTHNPSLNPLDKTAQTTLDTLLHEHPNITTFLDTGLAPTQVLSAAAYTGNVSMVNAALTHGAAVTEIVTRNAFFGPGLLSTYGPLVKVGHLNVNTHFSYAGTPLGKAILSNDSEFIKFLLSAGSDPNEVCFANYTPAELLIKQHSPLTHLDLLTSTPGSKFPTPDLLFAAVLAKNPDVIPYLVRHGSNVNAIVSECDSFDEEDSLWTPLHLAAKLGHEDCVGALLLKCGADVKMKDSQGRTARQVAAEYGHVGCEKVIMGTSIR